MCALHVFSRFARFLYLFLEFLLKFLFLQISLSPLAEILRSCLLGILAKGTVQLYIYLFLFPTPDLQCIYLSFYSPPLPHRLASPASQYHRLSLYSILLVVDGWMRRVATRCIIYVITELLDYSQGCGSGSDLREKSKTGSGLDIKEKPDQDPTIKKNRIRIRPFRKTGSGSYLTEFTYIFSK